MKKPLLFLGLDVHAQDITIALAEGDGGEVRPYGSIPNDLHALEKVLAKLRKAHPGVELRVCYEAGPTGFVLARRLAQLKIACAARPPNLPLYSPPPPRSSPLRSSPAGRASGSRPIGAMP